jgi:hypothetical protein
VWLFILAPLVGGALAAFVHMAFYGRPEPEPVLVVLEVDEVDGTETITVIEAVEE